MFLGRMRGRDLRTGTFRVDVRMFFGDEPMDAGEERALRLEASSPLLHRPIFRIVFSVFQPLVLLYVVKYIVLATPSITHGRKTNGEEHGRR